MAYNKEYHRAYYKEHKEKILAYQKKNIERKKENGRSYWRRNAEEIAKRRQVAYKKTKKLKKADYNRRNREMYARVRRDALERIGGIYGVKCRCCGEEREVFLAIDHVNGGGNKHRKGFKSAHSYMKYLATEAPLEEFQILCHNCNYAKRVGPCPHQTEIKVEIL